MSVFVAEMNKLKLVQQNLEKSDHTLIQQLERMDLNGKQYDFLKQFETSSNAEIENSRTDLKNVTSSLKLVKRILKNADLKEADVKNVKTNVVKIKENLESLKSNAKLSLENLEKEERKLTEDYQALEERIAEWDKPISKEFSKKPPRKVSTKINSSNNLTQGVKDFLTYVEKSGGHQNGWKLDDHNLFLKVRNKVKEPEKVAKILHTMLPDILEEEVLNHEKWYTKYLEFKNNQSVSLKNWRESKNQVKSFVTLEQSIKKSRTKSAMNLQYYTNKEYAQERLAKWKDEKQHKLEEKKDQELKNKLKEKEDFKKKQLQNEKVKKEVAKWKDQKKVAKEEELLRKFKAEEAEREYRAALAKKLIKDYQSQDQEFIQRKNELKKIDKVPKGAIYRKRFSCRDPQRLLKPTQQWMNRSFKSDSSPDLSANSFTFNMVPKLAIPEWRKGIY